MRQVIYEVPDQESGEHWTNPMWSIKELSDDQPESQAKEGCQRNTQRNRHDKAGLALWLSMMHTVEKKG